jgi:alkylation response protein AidB-like acyl-CoA dehydrogenase
MGAQAPGERVAPRRPLGAELTLFAESFRHFLENEVVPHYETWEHEGIVPRDVFCRAGEAGFLGMEIPEEYGGAGVDDFWFNAVLHDEIGRTGTTGFGVGLTLHNDVCVAYFMRYASEEQRERWLPGIASGELLTAVAMTEPDAGSDLGAIATRGVLDGDNYLVSGAKTFVTNGINADLLIVAVRTEPAPQHRGLSLLVVERDTPGFERGRNLAKIGMHSQDTAELFFNEAIVPRANLLGEPGKGFGYLVDNLPRERTSIALFGVAAARGAIEWTLPYVRERRAFGKPIGEFQAVRFALAEAHSEVEVAQAFVDRCVEKVNDDTLTPEEAAIAKWWCTEVQGRVIDKCLQLHGGYGYMEEYPIARAYVDARVTRLYGGTTEIMKEIIARGLGL